MMDVCIYNFRFYFSLVVCCFLMQTMMVTSMDDVYSTTNTLPSSSTLIIDNHLIQFDNVVAVATPTNTADDDATDVDDEFSQFAALWEGLEKDEFPPDEDVDGEDLIIDLAPVYETLKAANDVDEPFRIMLVGASGAGKTTLFNLLRNAAGLLREGKEMVQSREIDFGTLKTWNDVKLERLGEERKGGESSTSKVKKYEIPLPSGALIEVLDTPGFADTDGATTDKENLKKIAEAVKNIGKLYCVVMVMQGVGKRKSAHVDRSLLMMRQLMPKSALQNLVMVFTACQDTSMRDVNPARIEERLGCKVQEHLAP